MGSTKVISQREERKFVLESAHKPSGDQPEAIKNIVQNIDSALAHQCLLGVTGSGKTFTMANTIAQTNFPALILAPNKTLAAQMYAEFKALFPKNAVEFFVSYYDYYQPEAYIPNTDTYIEKDSSINEQIDRMRHSATRSLLERTDVIIVSSVSCIYGLGSPDSYAELLFNVHVNQNVERDQFLRDLVLLQYTRNDVDFSRASFRVRGDTVDIFPPFEEERIIRFEFFGDYIERILWVDPLRGTVLGEMESANIYPASHYANTPERMKTAIVSIQQELQERLKFLRDENRLLEAQRLEQRTYYDIEMIEQLGFCQGIENYSRHLTGRGPGEAPPTLIEYFPKNFLCFIDESHITVPQLGAMYRGDRARKMNLVEHGFRLPSALDNRPLNFQEFEKLMNRVIYVSATPGEYELQVSGGLVVEQIIRPTGLVDPQIEVRPVKFQVDDILKEIRIRIAKKQRVLITTLTKKMSEDLTEYYQSLDVKVKYLHSDIDTMERMRIIRDLRLGLFDVLIGINLLREGLDIPEVSLVAITDADKEGFLRSERSLIQTIGRAARNSEGLVILYADKITDSMKKAMGETDRRRTIQQAYNLKYNITPQTIKKAISGSLEEIFEFDYTNVPMQGPAKFMLDAVKENKNIPKDIPKEINKLRKKMKEFAAQLKFEEAAEIRDEVKRLQLIELSNDKSSDS